MKHCGVSRHAGNWGLRSTKNILEHNKTNLSDQLKLTSAIDLHKLLVGLVKPNCPWYYECSLSHPQESLRALRRASDSRSESKIMQVPWPWYGSWRYKSKSQRLQVIVHNKSWDDDTNWAIQKFFPQPTVLGVGQNPFFPRVSKQSLQSTETYPSQAR